MLFKKFKKMRSSVRDTFEKNFKKLVMCSKCHSFYHKRTWQFETPQDVRTDADGEVFVRLTQCPSCLEYEVTLNERDSDLISYGLLA